MTVVRLEHYNIRTLRYAETVSFYEDVLGLKAQVAPMMPPGSRPSWLYDASGTPVVHLIAVDPADPEGTYARASRFRGTVDSEATFQGSGAVDHVAFQCEGVEEFRARLENHGVPFFDNAFPDVGIRQLFIRDPNGIAIELNFTIPIT